MLLSSCAGTTQLARQFEQNSCAHQGSFPLPVKAFPKPLHEIAVDTALQIRFSVSSLNVAHAIGILEPLSTFVAYRKRQEQIPTTENRLTTLELSQRITQRINLASLEVSAIASELDCEEEKVSQIADYLSGAEAALETKLTVAAIAVGAAGALVPALLIRSGEDSRNVEYLTIASGITEALIGGAILLNKRKIELRHPRNPLREIWEERERSEIFPPFVWYYLNYYNPEKPAEKSLRYGIIERWLGFKQIEDATTKRKRQLLALYFGNGGKYTTGQLYNRAKMYEQVESSIKLLKQDLTLLTVEFEELK